MCACAMLSNCTSSTQCCTIYTLEQVHTLLTHSLPMSIGYFKFKGKNKAKQAAVSLTSPWGCWVFLASSLC